MISLMPSVHPFRSIVCVPTVSAASRGHFNCGLRILDCGLKVRPFGLTSGRTTLLSGSVRRKWADLGSQVLRGCQIRNLQSAIEPPRLSVANHRPSFHPWGASAPGGVDDCLQCESLSC